MASEANARIRPEKPAAILPPSAPGGSAATCEWVGRLSARSCSLMRPPSNELKPSDPPPRPERSKRLKLFQKINRELGTAPPEAGLAPALG